MNSLMPTRSRLSGLLPQEVTLLSVIESTAGRLALLCTEAKSVPGPIFEIGHTNSRYRFTRSAHEFVNRWNVHGPAHHCAVGVSHIAERIGKLGALLGLETIRVC
jgi:L-arabinose isomerase